MELTLEQVKVIYRDAIDAKARDGEGLDWWASVAADVLAVVSAPSIRSASDRLAWWHSEWEWVQIGDSASAAAKRIRGSAQRLMLR